jgi:ribosomal protein L11 methyltransferase
MPQPRSPILVRRGEAPAEEAGSLRTAVVRGGVPVRSSPSPAADDGAASLGAPARVAAASAGYGRRGAGTAQLRSAVVVLRVEVPAEEAEVAADLLWGAGASAVGEEAAGDTVVLTTDLDECPPGVAGRGWPWAVTVDDGSWQDGWRPYARAVRAGPFLVRPPWVDADVSPGLLELVLDGGRAFGTGAHPSTTLALELLAGAVPAGGTVLDVGCGSGALAVGAALLGAGRVRAIDLDPAAIEATTANAAANGVADVVEVERADAAALDGTYDLVVANLGAPLVFDLAGTLTACVTPAGGCLILSGLLDDRAADVPAAYPMLDTDTSGSLDGWTAVRLRASARRNRSSASSRAVSDTLKDVASGRAANATNPGSSGSSPAASSQ